MSQAEAAAGGDTPVMAAKRATAGERTLIAVVVIYAGVLLAAPLIALAWGSLAEGLSGFVRAISQRDAVDSLRLTVVMAIGATLINTLFGISIAWVLIRDDFPGKRLLSGLVDLPFAVSPIIAGFMLILLFGRAGWLTPLINMLGIKVVFATPGILLATTFICLPFVVREVTPVLAQVSRDQEDAARTIGASGWKTFWHVTLPAIRWGLLYGVSLTFARAVGEIGAVLVVSGHIAGLTETSTLFILRALEDRNYVGAYAMAMLLAIASFVLLMVIELVRKRSDKS
jgi:sulfate transport system permease protein